MCRGAEQAKWPEIAALKDETPSPAEVSRADFTFRLLFPPPSQYDGVHTKKTGGKTPTTASVTFHRVSFN